MFNSLICMLPTYIHTFINNEKRINSKKKVILTYMVMPWCSITHSVHWSHCIHLHCAHTIHIVHAIHTSHIVHVAHTIHILLVGCLVMHPHIAHLKAKNKMLSGMLEIYFVFGFEYFMHFLHLRDLDELQYHLIGTSL